MTNHKKHVRRRNKHVENFTAHIHELSVIKDESNPPPSNNNSTRSTSLATSAIANETFSTTSSSTDDTLSMISTPWATESLKSESESDSGNSSYIFWTNSGSSYSSYSIEPKTTTTYGIPSPEVQTDSELTVTLLGDVLTSPSVSRFVQPLKRPQSGSSPTYTSWSLETYTSTGLMSSNHDVVKVNYPWSPCTFFSNADTDFYPSSLTLISQKGSRETVGAKYQPLHPMNYVVVSRDDHPNLDWILVKQKGIFTRKK